MSIFFGYKKLVGNERLDGSSREGSVVAKQGPERYVSYSMVASKLRYVMQNVNDQVRYMAYSSDIGESFRLVLQPGAVRASYGVAFAYVIGDTAYELKRKDTLGVDREALTGTLLHRAVFHGLVSLYLPALIIHTAVHQARHFFAAEVFRAWPLAMKWGPSAAGLCIVPFLPLCDPPAEFFLDHLFDRWWPSWRQGEHAE